MAESLIEFYCSEADFALILGVPSMRRAMSIYRFTARKTTHRPVTYIAVFRRILDGKDVICSIQSWLRYEHGIKLMDPERRVLWDGIRTWAQLFRIPFVLDDYEEDYEIEEMNV